MRMTFRLRLHLPLGWKVHPEDMTYVLIRYFEGCPHWRLADQRAREALRSAGRTDVTIEYEQVDTPEDAARTGFRGSPTILVDGVDPWGESDAPVGLSCRIYRTGAGAQGAPTVQEIERALAGAT
jgi:hypothetical protein